MKIITQNIQQYFASQDKMQNSISTSKLKNQDNFTLSNIENTNESDLNAESLKRKFLSVKSHINKVTHHISSYNSLHLLTPNSKIATRLDAVRQKALISAVAENNQIALKNKELSSLNFIKKGN